MLIRETADAFWMVQQPDHAHLSGLMADAWNDPYFNSSPYKEDTILAVYAHDNAWIPADQTPFWNDAHSTPFSFIQYPSAIKMMLYTNGINALEQQNPYSALLVSLHYSSFMNQQVEAEQAFFQQEAARQQRLKHDLGIHTDEQQTLLHYHFDLLQFCDNLSLYLGLNKPGTSKEEEYPFFKEGFKNSEHFAFTNHQKIYADWPSAHQVLIRPFPFRHDFDITLKVKAVSKEAVKANGLIQAYSQTEFTDWPINLASE